MRFRPPSKFRNVRTSVDGHTFASLREAKRYQELRLLERAGEISELELQPRFQCNVNGQHICDAVMDFAYDRKGGLRVVEDVKGFDTPMSRLKRKLVKACHGVSVEIVK